MTGGDDPMQEEALKREAWKWILHMTSGEATKADIAALERWCAERPRHAEAYARASEAWRVFGVAAENAVRQHGLAQRNPLSTERRSTGGRMIGRRAFLGGARGGGVGAGSRFRRRAPAIRPVAVVE